MSRKAAPRKAGAFVAAVFSLASTFNTGASAQETFRVGGDFSGPRSTDAHGIEVPGCVSGTGQNVKFTPRAAAEFVNTDNIYFDFDRSRGKGVNDGPTVFYNYDLLEIMPVAFKNFMMYQACILNYYGDQGLRHPINTTDYTLSEIRADCFAVVHLREEKRFAAEDLQTLRSLLDREYRSKSTTPLSPKTERRLRNISDCYYRNTTSENLASPGRFNGKAK
jgi:hypothetical protein